MHLLIGLVMIAESVSLGVLSLPATLASLGLVPYVELSDASFTSC